MTIIPWYGALRCLHHARGKAQSAGGLFQHLALAKKNRGRNWQQWQMFDLSLQVKEVNLSFCMATFIQSVTNSDRLSRALQRDMSICRSVWMMLYTHTHSQYHPIHLNTISLPTATFSRPLAKCLPPWSSCSCLLRSPGDGSLMTSREFGFTTWNSAKGLAYHTKSHLHYNTSVCYMCFCLSPR